jgi:hypothetical protein
MKKFIQITGIVGAVALLLSIVFKLLHWMGAPTLLGIGTLCILLFMFGHLVEKLKQNL